MDSELIKAALPVVGGALALAGGVFTFISGRLRDAPDTTAKSEIFAITWVWVATAVWFVGIGIAVFASHSVASIPFFCATLAIQYRSFVAQPNPPSRRAVANFALLCTTAATAILFSIFVDFARGTLDIQNRQIEILKQTVETLRSLPK